MSQDEHDSLLVAHLWDVRASLEAQVRCLTAIQHTFTAFRKLTDSNDRAVLRAKILSDLADIEGHSFTVLRLLKPTVEEAKRELNAA